MNEVDTASVPGSGQCLLCGSIDQPTVEHIIPQALWKRFGIDADREDLAVFRTTLCYRHNQATSALHQRPEMMELIETGAPVTRKTLQHLGDWALWVTLLLGLARSSGVLGAQASRDLLMRRFDTNQYGTTPKGVRVYAARISKYVEPAEPPITPYLLALRGDSRVLLDASGEPSGYGFREGPVNASDSIGLGKVALLIVGPTHSSGPDHRERLDQAAASVGMERIFPLGPLPGLNPTPISMTDVSKLFTVIPFAADPSLMPSALKTPGSSTLIPASSGR